MAHNKCWTTYHLSQRGLPHPERCPLCDQNGGTLDHLLISCVFAYQVWFYFLEKVGLESLSTLPDVTFFEGFWTFANERVDGQVHKGLNSVIIIGAWAIWTHRNQCVFDDISPLSD